MKLFIGCASSEDIPEYYYKDCEELLEKILVNNDLIYGAYNKGIMNIAYKIAKKNNRHITGITPREYTDDVSKIDMDETIIVNNIEERTYELLVRSDMIIFLPGGIGTINEIFSAIDMKRCGELDKPIIIYNSNHYFDKLLVFLDKLYGDKFSPINDSKCYKVCNNLNDIINML